MAYIPTCDFGPHAWLKKKHLYYVGKGSGGNFERYRLRFCDEHTAVVEQDLLEFEVGAQVAALRSHERSTINCLACGEEVDEIVTQVFITGYPAQDERKDYWGSLHEGHELPEYLQDPYLSREAQQTD